MTGNFFGDLIPPQDRKTISRPALASKKDLLDRDKANTGCCPKIIPLNWKSAHCLSGGGKFRTVTSSFMLSWGVQITATNLAGCVQAKAFGVAVKMATRSQAVSACRSRENEVLQLSCLIDRAALSKLLLTHFSYIAALVEKLLLCLLRSRI